MNYISTRGNTESVTFKDSVMMGLARDGGLLVPAKIPNVSNKLDNWMHLSFQELALEIITLFSDDISKSDLKKSLIKAIQRLDIVRLLQVKMLGIFLF